MDGALEKVKDSDGYLETVSFLTFRYVIQHMIIFALH